MAGCVFAAATAGAGEGACRFLPFVAAAAGVGLFADAAGVAGLFAVAAGVAGLFAVAAGVAGLFAVVAVVAGVFAVAAGFFRFLLGVFSAGVSALGID